MDREEQYILLTALGRTRVVRPLVVDLLFDVEQLAPDLLDDYRASVKTLNKFLEILWAKWDEEAGES